MNITITFDYNASTTQTHTFTSYGQALVGDYMCISGTHIESRLYMLYSYLGSPPDNMLGWRLQWVPGEAEASEATQLTCK